MKGKKRISLVAALVCIFALVFSLGIMSACGNSDSGNAQVTESASGNWYYGSVLPAEGLGEEGDFYLNTKTLASYKKTAAGWSTVSLEESGEWLYGVGQPDAEVGSANDFYLDTQNGDLYHKTATGWENILKLFGKNGRDGVVWFSGNGKPTELPKGSMVGDFYLDYSKFDVYQLGEDGKTWNPLGSLKGSDGETPALPEAEKVTVTFDVNGGNALEAESVEVAKGDSIAALPVPTRKNYTFLGWFTGTEVNDGQVTTVTPISRSMTLVAHWVFSGRYTFDTFSVDGNVISAKNGVSFRIDTTHEFSFTAHGMDDSVFQIWYAKEGVNGQAVWGKPLAGTVYTNGYKGEIERGEAGAMTITIGAASFTAAGKYSLYMEADGIMSNAWTVEVKEKLVVTPASPEEEKLELIDGKIESPETTIEMEFGETKEFTFVLQHNALTADSKPRVILGANGKRSFTWDETRDDYEIDGNGYDMLVDESFYYTSRDEYLTAVGKTPYGEFSFSSRNLKGSYNSDFVCAGHGLPYGKLSAWVATGPDGEQEYKRGVICAYYQGVEYWYDEAQGKFVTLTWPQETLPVADGKDLHVKPYLYTYTYGAEQQPRGFTGLYTEEGSTIQTYQYDSEYKFNGVMRVSKFEVHEGYAEITLQMSATPPKGKNTSIKYNPTLIYELDVDGKPVRFDLIKGEKITEEEGYEKTRLNVTIKQFTPPVQPEAGSIFERLNVGYLNDITSDTYNLVWTGKAEDFEFLGMYVNDAPISENEIYKCADYELAYRYEGITELDDGKKRVTFDFYYLLAFKATTAAPIRVEYRYQGVTYSQAIQIYTSTKDSAVVKERGYALLYAWEKLLDQYKGDPDEKGYLKRIHEIIDPMLENKELLSPAVLSDVFGVYGNGASKVEEMDLAQIVTENDTPFETETVEHFNAVAGETVNKLLAKYPGVDRAILRSWYEEYIYTPIDNQIVGSSWQPRYTNNMYNNFFYGAYSDSTPGKKGYGVVEYVNTHAFGCVEIMAWYIEYMFDNYAPATTVELLDQVYLATKDYKPTKEAEIINAAKENFVAAYEAYHASPEGSLEAYIQAAKEYTIAKNLETTQLGVNATANAAQVLDWSFNQLDVDYLGHAHDEDETLAALWDALTEANIAVFEVELSAETLGEYAEKVEAYAAAMAAYSIAADAAHKA